MKQQISQLLDGELDAADSAVTIARIGADKSCDKQWRLICTVRAVMRGNYAGSACSVRSFADKVAMQLESEPAITAPNNLLHHQGESSQNGGDFNGNGSNVVALQQKSNKLIKLSILAIAASFVAVTLFKLNPLIATDENAAKNIAATPSINAAELAQFIAAEQELQALVMAHGEFSSMAGLNGLATYAKIVNADGAQ